MQDEFLLFFAGRINMENGFSVFWFDLVLFAINEYFDFCFAMAFFIYYKLKISILFNAANCVREFGVNMLIASRGIFDINWYCFLYSSNWMWFNFTHLKEIWVIIWLFPTTYYHVYFSYICKCYFYFDYLKFSIKYLNSHITNSFCWDPHSRLHDHTLRIFSSQNFKHV